MRPSYFISTYRVLRLSSPLVHEQQIKPTHAEVAAEALTGLVSKSQEPSMLCARESLHG